MYNDTTSDFITRIRNAVMADKKELLVRSNKLVHQVASILQKEGLIEKIEPQERMLQITLSDDGVHHIRRLSKPSLRSYVGYKEIPRPKSGLGLVIISTPKGVLTGHQARKQKVGGELICEVW